MSDQPGYLNTHPHDAKHVLSFTMLRNCRDPSNPLRSLIIIFTCTSANVIYCIHVTCILRKKSYISETGRQLDDRFQEHHRDVEKDEKNASKWVARPLNLPIILSNMWQSAATPYIKEAQKAAKL